MLEPAAAEFSVPLTCTSVDGTPLARSAPISGDETSLPSKYISTGVPALPLASFAKLVHPVKLR